MLNNTVHNRLVTGTVAFTAFLNNSLVHIPPNQVIIFEDVLTNVGNAYDKIDGHFQVCVNLTISPRFMMVQNILVLSIPQKFLS